MSNRSADRWSRRAFLSTMGAAGTIIGISMPEPGVSRKIAVRLDDVGEDGQLRKTG